MKSIQQSAEIGAVVSRHSPEAKPYKFTASSTRPLSAAIGRGRRTQHNDDVTNIYSDAKTRCMARLRWPFALPFSPALQHRRSPHRQHSRIRPACRRLSSRQCGVTSSDGTIDHFAAVLFQGAAARVPTSSAPIRRL